ncbi:PP2C family serine/threonine-protein phosphatase [Aquimarina longa]|uniref:PP2C family serine/threonine-protein phosphatase n=1 Tax=Aquimarina longa TaxID=1080221 RepID=UPI0007866218|nr:PP2C family serine/threonine-protein phosphatase [Aquimarina longa]
MEQTKKYIEKFLLQNNIPITSNKETLFNDFASNEDMISTVKIIQENQKKMLDKWRLKNRIDDILQQVIMLPNATVNKVYEAKIEFIKLNWNDVIFSEFEGLEEIGLQYDNNEDLIFGTPTASGDIKVKFLFRVDGEKEDSVLNEKTITLIINPDPKSLWKNKESDITDPHWKEDDVAVSGSFLDKKIVVASKRGRSHANVGSFRDDDFAYKNYEKNGWSVVAVSDGAGSATLSRKGAQLACELVVSYFEENFLSDKLEDFDEVIAAHYQESTAETTKKISHFVYKQLSAAAYHVHKELEKLATQTETVLKDYHATLIFALVKKYDFGYTVLTFGVGDCPIGLLSKDMSEINLMNWLDVGEFGGGTRFITMKDIFQNEKFTTRFGFKLVEDFSYLMLMTDGIYDPKFVVEANLEKIEKWKEFVDDLKGNNEDKLSVDFETSEEGIEEQLSEWMDFWNPGNHDDRTLAIIY